MSLNVFYTSIHGFLPHQLSRPSIHATFRLTYEKHGNVQKDCAVHAQSHSKKHYQVSLKRPLSKTILLCNKLRRSNLKEVN